MNGETGFCIASASDGARLLGSEGSSPLGAPSCHKLVYGRIFDPDHDAVMRIGGEAPGGGPILLVGISATFEYGFPPPRIVDSAVRRKASASAE
jgi:hypothetical protein